MRHLSAISKYTVQMLLDMKPVVSILGNSGERVEDMSWASFQDRFAVDTSIVGEASRIRHFVAGQIDPWQADFDKARVNSASSSASRPVGPDAPVSAVVAAVAAGQTSATAGATSGESGAAAEKPSEPSLLETWMSEIAEGAAKGNLLIVNSRLQKLRKALTVPESHQPRVSMTSGKGAGGLMYRPDFMLNTVLAAEYVYLACRDYVYVYV